ncbi:Uncharacterised protein [Enterobacter cloacae]|nr:Uncharacterised protein [Enterobacter cloacae]
MSLIKDDILQHSLGLFNDRGIFATNQHIFQHRGIRHHDGRWGFINGFPTQCLFRYFELVFLNFIFGMPGFAII